MTFRSLKSHPITAIARNSQTWTTASLAATLCLLATQALAGPQELPGREQGTRAFGSSRIRSERESYRYTRDHGIIKNATLENEATFFDRLEREKKIEEIKVELEASQAAQRLIVSRLSPLSMQLLAQFEQSTNRCLDQLDEAGQYAAAAHTELRRYHEMPTPTDKAIAAGRIEAISLTSRIRRTVRSAHRWFQSAQGNLEAARTRLDEAHVSIAASLAGMKEDDARRAELIEANKAIEGALQETTEASGKLKEILAQLEDVHRQYLPDCAPSTVPSGAPLLPGVRPVENRALTGMSDCQQASIEILSRSKPAIAMLEKVLADQAALVASVDRARTLSESASKRCENADALVNPGGEKLRHLHDQSNQLLSQANNDLSKIRRALTRDEPGETTHCVQCGDIVIRTRRPIDPACACALTNAEMLQAEEAIRKAQALVDQMDQILREITEKQELSRAELELGATSERLKRAIARGEEYRNQKFDQYPGDSPPPSLAELQPREFPPMVATYVARETWHYPLYFEDISLERYGHTHGCFQPIVSYGKFLADLALLPYNVCLDPPCTLQYDLGMYRPGDDVPHLIYLPRPDCKAALFEAAVWTGLMFLP